MQYDYCKLTTITIPYYNRWALFRLLQRLLQNMSPYDYYRLKHFSRGFAPYWLERSDKEERKKKFRQKKESNDYSRRNDYCNDYCTCRRYDYCAYNDYSMCRCHDYFARCDYCNDYCKR